MIISINVFYKEACNIVAQSGNGSEGEKYNSFYNFIRKKYCKWNDQLHEVYGDKPTSYPIWTNEMPSDDGSDDSNKEQNFDNDDLYHDNRCVDGDDVSLHEITEKN